MQKWFDLRHPRVSAVIGEVIDRHLSYSEREVLVELAKTALEIERDRVPGIFVEAGCALGGSALVLAAAKAKTRPFLVYDVFGMIPPPSERDGQDVHERYKVIASGKATGIGDQQYYGYEKNLAEKVKKTFENFQIPITNNNIELIQGLYKDIMIIKQQVALAHIDCDWYESVLTCLTRIEPMNVSGGTIIIDDYYAWSGCTEAVDSYFAKRPGNSYRFMRKRRLHIVKI